LVDAKLAELGAPPVASHATPFQLTPARQHEMQTSSRRELAAVLRAFEAPFDLQAMIERFSQLWGKTAV
jgi:hypothetical protein